MDYQHKTISLFFARDSFFKDRRKEEKVDACRKTQSKCTFNPTPLASTSLSQQKTTALSLFLRFQHEWMLHNTKAQHEGRSTGKTTTFSFSCCHPLCHEEKWPYGSNVQVAVYNPYFQLSKRGNKVTLWLYKVSILWQ